MKPDSKASKTPGVRPGLPSLSPDRPRQVRRIGYAGTGFSFYFHRVLGRSTLQEDVLATEGCVREPWMASKTAADIPQGFTIVHTSHTLPGVVADADADGNLAEIHMFVAADHIDPRAELRVWHHEVGHAVDFACGPYLSRAQHLVRPDEDHLYKLSVEFPAYCTELLCDAAALVESENPAPPVSGFMSCFPWLKPAAALGSCKEVSK